jgi:hypothetical protein
MVFEWEGVWKIISDFVLYFSFFYPILYIKGFVINNRAFKIFTIYLVSIAIIQFSQTYVVKVLRYDSNIFLSHYYLIVQFLLLSLFYKELLRHKWIYTVTLLVLLFVAYQLVSTPSMIDHYNPIGITITQIILVGYSIMYFYKSLSGHRQFLIVNIGIFFYLLASTLIFASGNLVFNLNFSKEVSNTLGKANDLLYLVFQILILAEWWKNYSFPKIKS